MFGNEVAAALAMMREENEVYSDYLPNQAIVVGKKMAQAINGLWEEVLDEIMDLLKTELPLQSPHAAVWWYSILISAKKEPQLFYDFVTYVRRKQKSFSCNTNYFLFYQLKSLRFRYSELNDSRIQVELWKYYQEIVQSFKESMGISFDWIPYEKRNPGKIIVITEQMIAIQHGPTKTALDRCKCLMEKMGKEILLINTTEILSELGQIPFYGLKVGNCDEQLKRQHALDWKGTMIPYYQCEHHMPDRKQLNDLLRSIREFAPQYVVSIGGSGMFANLVNQMLPVLTVGLSPSEFEFTTTKYQTIGRPMKKLDLEILKAVGYTSQNVIESVFTSSLKPQTEVTTRKEQGLMEDKFLLVTVGARLDDEITDEFLEMLDNAMLADMQWVIIGSFSHYGEYLERHPGLRDKSVNLGYCDDILSRMELCDLYVNPTRKGGGTSCVEAMYKGIPVVTVDYGDVSVNVGEEFCVNNYEEMKRQIIRYGTDHEFYEAMRKKALERVEKLLDTDREFVRIMKEVEKREVEEA